MKLRMIRFLWLLLVLSLLSLLLVFRCSYNMTPTNQDHLPQDRVSQRQLLLPNKETVYMQQIQDLQKTIDDLKVKVKVAMENAISNKAQGRNSFDFENYVNGKLKTQDILHGVSLKSEFEDISFNRFNLNRIYLVDPGLGKRVVEKPIGYKKKDLSEVIIHAMHSLNARRRHLQEMFKPEHFIEGIYRNIPTIGCQYEMYFTNIDSPSSTKSGNLIKVTVLRPSGPLMVPEITAKISTTKQINLIVPLKGRVDTLKLFIDHFVRVCVLRDRHVFLTVVYFGDSGLNNVKAVLNSMSKRYNFKDVKLVTLNEQFSRGRGLQAGTQAWNKDDVLLFLCDVDVIFSLDFLERCRLNAQAGKRVYYPMVFSLYNPHVVYSLHDSRIPSQQEQLMISKETGFWRDFGYGMTCQYLSDFKKIGGFDFDIKGWGGEDVLLYRKYIKSTMMVVRATDPGIFHIWHEKNCDPHLSSDQYRSCIRSKALNEASHAQLGLLAFKNEVDLHRSYKTKFNGAV